MVITNINIVYIYIYIYEKSKKERNGIDMLSYVIFIIFI